MALVFSETALKYEAVKSWVIRSALQRRTIPITTVRLRLKNFSELMVYMFGEIDVS